MDAFFHLLLYFACLFACSVRGFFFLLDLPHIKCETLGEICDFFRPQFFLSAKWKWNIWLLSPLNEKMIKCFLAQRLLYSKLLH